MLLNAFHELPLPVYGNGQNVRDWIYVQDHCKGVDAVLKKGRVGEVYNLGGQSERRNLEVVKTILAQLNRPESLITFVKDRLGHDYRYAIDFSKAKTELGWEPEMTFEAGIQLTVKWYVEHPEWWRPLWEKWTQKKDQK